MSQEIENPVEPLPPEPVLPLLAPAEPSSGRLRTHVILFFLTAVSCFLVQGGASDRPGGWLEGLWYAIPIMTILLCHESGHFLMCKHYGVPATLPYFIPMPFSPFGTFGAFIKMKGFIPTRKAIFDIGAAGPIAGFLVCLPCIALGLKFSKTLPVSDAQAAGLVTLGEPLLLKGLSWLVLGDLPKEIEVVLHPLAFAGWAGLFVTGLNLIPLGQLDGGHILYGLVGSAANPLYKLGLLLCIVAASLWYKMLLPLTLLLLLVGREHPPAMDPEAFIGKGRTLLGCLMLVLFVISFTPTPFSF